MLRIFCVSFDRGPRWESDCVKPLQAGRARTGLDLGITADDTGDNISAENARYGEMTAWYWVWKNYLPSHPRLTHVGFCHYRRFLDFTAPHGGRTRRQTYRRFRRMFDAHYREAEILRCIGEADLVMRAPEDSGFPTVRAQFQDAHPGNVADFDRFVSLIRERHPSEAPAIDDALGCGRLAMEMQFVMKRPLFESFMEEMFALCREYERRWSWSGPKDGSKARVPAFLVERLFMVWLAIRRRDPSFAVKELPLVKLNGRPWWYHLVKPVFALMPWAADRLYDRFK